MSNAAAIARKAKFDSLEQEAYLSLWRSYDRLRIHEDELFERFGLTPQQYNVLRVIEGHADPMPTLAIAERTVSRAPDITRMIDRLELQGWVQRERPANDRRQVLVAITVAGRKLLTQISGPLRACHERQLGHLSRDQLRGLIDVLRLAREPHEADASIWK